MRKSLLIVSVIGLTWLACSGQQTPYFTQFTELKSYVNPAATGHTGRLLAGFAGRHQWLGLHNLDGQHIGPRSYMIFADIPFADEQSSLGIMTLYDRIGSEESILLRVNGAYYFNPGRYHTFSLGLSADYIYKSFDVSHMPPGSPVSGMAFSGGASGIDLGTGIFYQHEGGTYVGISAYNLMQTAIEYSGFNYLNKRQYHFLAGTSIPLVNTRSMQISFLPSLLIQTTEVFIPQYDIQSALLINNRLFVGVTYRYDDSIGAVAGLYVGNIRIGISYDYTTSLLREGGSYGSPELVISYSSKPKKRPSWQDFCY